MYIGGIRSRIRRMEDAAGLRPPVFVVILANYVMDECHLNDTDNKYKHLQVDLTSGVDEEGHADISPWYGVVFLRGSQREREEILNELRKDPEYQKPEWVTYDA